MAGKTLSWLVKPCHGIFAMYCKTRYFYCILISRFWKVEISLHCHCFFAFSQCFTSIYRAFDWKTEFLLVSNITISSYKWNSQKCVLRFALLQTFFLRSSSACLSALRTMFSMSSLLSPPDDWITTVYIDTFKHVTDLCTVETHLLHLHCVHEKVSPLNILQ